jgi:H3 lysine-79-specific histone-lysine N-methyltransferase
MFRKYVDPNAKKPTIRRETVQVKAPLSGPSNKPLSNGASKPVPQKRPGPPEGRFKLKARSGVKSSAAPAPARPQTSARKVAAASRALKRKSATPERRMFSSDEEDSSDDHDNSDSDALSRKRIKSSVSSVDSSGPGRSLVREAAYKEEPEDVQFLQGADATSGEQEAKFKNPWGQEDFSTVLLQYPSNTKQEKFELKWPKNEKDDYKPMEDIKETILEICAFYLPQPLRERYIGRDSLSSQAVESFEHRIKRAWNHQSIPEFIGVVENFNSLIKPLVADGTIRRELATKRRLPLQTVRRILDQVYARTVSPRVESLRAYKNGTDNVYGELLPRFCDIIFDKTKLNESHVFVDLGSGVGNVVLQAALQVGCESWGIEMMKNPCDLADLQVKEFPGRTALWGLSVGDVHLIRGDFTQNPQVPEILRKADVVLVNNQAFTPELNNQLLNMFLDLKDGCKVASLKPFVREDYKYNERNTQSLENIFTQERFGYFSGCVSWTDGQGSWFIATKDDSRYKEHAKNHSQQRSHSQQQNNPQND